MSVSDTRPTSTQAKVSRVGEDVSRRRRACINTQSKVSQVGEDVSLRDQAYINPQAKVRLRSLVPS